VSRDVLQFYKVNAVNRLDITPKLGEPLFVQDTNELYIGDNTTPGGIVPSNFTGGSECLTNNIYSSRYIDANTTLLQTDGVIIANPTATDIVITLPQVVSYVSDSSFRIYHIYNISNQYKVSIVTTGADVFHEGNNKLVINKTGYNVTIGVKYNSSIPQESSWYVLKTNPVIVEAYRNTLVSLTTLRTATTTDMMLLGPTNQWAAMIFNTSTNILDNDSVLFHSYNSNSSIINCKVQGRCRIEYSLDVDYNSTSTWNVSSEVRINQSEIAVNGSYCYANNGGSEDGVLYGYCYADINQNDNIQLALKGSDNTNIRIRSGYLRVIIE